MLMEIQSIAQSTSRLARPERWATRIGVILAVAGSAVGLGNFLRFPGVVVRNGGGAFMIPYFLAFLLLGIPVCWAEWIMGRRAGRLSGLSSCPGLLGTLSRGGKFRYFGVLGLFIPLVIYMWYVYVESWCLAYTWFTITGQICLGPGGDYTAFFNQFNGESTGQFFSGITANYIFFLITFFLNFFLIYRGLSRGIEKFCLVAMPLLVIAAVLVALRVLTLGTPDPTKPLQNVSEALGYMWNPDWVKLKDPEVWLAACGQIFFSLSVGFGVVLTYASYLTKQDDVVLSGLTASATNGFCEVCLGGLIVVPAAFVFLGIGQMQDVVGVSSFTLGFVTMPHVFAQMPAGRLFQALFYFLLFLAGITSSLSMLQPAIAFFEEGFNMNRPISVAFLGMLTFLGANAVVLTPGLTVLATMDTCASDLGIPLLALAELFLFIFVLKVSTAIQEGGYGANMKLPFWFGFVITYLSPVFLLAILVGWFVNKLRPLFDASVEWTPMEPLEKYTILVMIAFFFFLWLLVGLAWPNMKRRYVGYAQSSEG
jgi:SNF family Na+-dependent transporter